MKIKARQLNSFIVYEVCFTEDDGAIIKKIEKFANQTAGNTYPRSKMSPKEHKKNIIIGKRAEYAFSRLLYKYTGIDILPDFKNKVDLYDFRVSGIKIDIKASSLEKSYKKLSSSNPNKNITFKEVLNYALLNFNFTVLKDQSLKDIIIQPLYHSRKNYDCFYFSVWQYVKKVVCEGREGKLDDWGDYFLLPLKKGKPLSEFFELVKDKEGKNEGK